MPDEGKKLKPESGKKPADGTLVVKSDTLAARVQTHPKVLPKEAEPTKEAAGPETWDDRPIPEILKGIIREHTLIGFVAAFLLGGGPKLPTVAQSVQLLFGSVLGLLFLTCAQLRYMWLGATWVDVAPPYNEGVSSDAAGRIPFLSTIGFASAVVGWTCVLCARWLFFLANQMYMQSTSPKQGLIIYAATWCIVLLICSALAIGAVNMAGNMDAPIVQVDVMLGWLLSMTLQWILFEPAILVTYAFFTLLLKWCTSFEDLPEVKAEIVKVQKEEQLRHKAEMQAQKPALQGPKDVLQLKGPKKGQ